jgi:hypothetical protein
MRRYVPPFSFGAVLAVLCAGTVIGVGASIVFHRSILIPFVIGAAIAVGIVYIVVFGAPALEEAPRPDSVSLGGAGPSASSAPSSADPGTPESPRGPSSAAEPEPDEPYYDPVEEADRLDSARGPDSPPPSGSDDPK